MTDMIRVHGTAVAFARSAVLLRGPSGVGKSDVALRLIEAGGCLVADDQSELRNRSGNVIVSPPPSLAGNIELRGIGIMACSYRRAAVLRLVVDLGVPSDVRCPPPVYETFFGMVVPVLRIKPFDVSTAARIRFCLESVERRAWPPTGFSQEREKRKKNT